MTIRYDKMNPKIRFIFMIGFTFVASFMITGLVDGARAFGSIYVTIILCVFSTSFAIHATYTYHKIIQAHRRLTSCR